MPEHVVTIAPARHESGGGNGIGLPVIQRRAADRHLTKREPTGRLASNL
jgi:hypothetical protein